MIQWLKEKHTNHKPTQQGYRRPPDGGDQGTKHQTKHKANDREKARLARLPEMVMHIDARGHRKMVRRGN